MALKNGRDVLYASGKERGDEFGKGTVGKPSETEALAKGGNQGGMGDETLNYGGGHFEQEKAGLEDGVSARETIDLDTSEPEYNYAVDSFTGNAPERKVGRANNQSVSGKAGKKFEIGEM
jgi:hypothetical protein